MARVVDQHRHRHETRPTPAALGAAGVGTKRDARCQRYIMSSDIDMSSIFIIPPISSSEIPTP